MQVMRKYCHLCGDEYVSGKSQPWQCKGCGNLSFENPSPTTDLLLFNDKGEALLAKRAIDPQKGKYDFPGGFVEVGETFEAAMMREAFEELGLTSKEYSKPIFVSSQASVYEYSKELHPVLGVTFAAKLLTGRAITPKDDVEAVKFVALKDIEKVEFADRNLIPVVIKAHSLLFS